MSNNLEQQDLAIVLREFIKEKRSVKRWKNFRFFLLFSLILLIVIVSFAGSNSVTLGGPHEGKGYVAFLKFDGMIEPGRDFSAEEVLPKLRDAFSDSAAKGLIIDINSGGGTPVQAAIIHDAIIDFKKRYNKKVVVVGEDTMASGAYYVAVAADKIYVNPNTITGSIGVVMKGFGLNDLIKKIGVDRRVYVSGQNKDRLDPFLPQNTQDVEKVHQVISEVYDNFVQAVMQGRAGKLHGDKQELFSGDFWSGKTALKLGLVDGLGNLTDVMRSEFNVASYKNYSGSGGLLKSAFSQFGTAMNTLLQRDEAQMVAKI